MEEEKKNSDAAAEILTDFIQAGHAEILTVVVWDSLLASTPTTSLKSARGRLSSQLLKVEATEEKVMVLANAHLQQEPAQEEQIEDPGQMQWESFVNQDAPLLNRALWECSYLMIPP